MGTSVLIYVNATKSIRAENLECSNVLVEKYRGIPHAQLKWIVNHRRAMPFMCLESFFNPRPNFAIYYPHFLTFSFLLDLSYLSSANFFARFSIFLIKIYIQIYLGRP